MVKLPVPPSWKVLTIMLFGKFSPSLLMGAIGRTVGLPGKRSSIPASKGAERPTTVSVPSVDKIATLAPNRLNRVLSLSLAVRSMHVRSPGRIDCVDANPVTEESESVPGSRRSTHRDVKLENAMRGVT
mmetsp:Transcript_11076/g.24938  ORF Transcript_11076/g.24938 Transcript_11076/m.24938 type:complete len:129 (+) Transcript_11076:139-525(+)